MLIHFKLYPRITGVTNSLYITIPSNVNDLCIQTFIWQFFRAKDLNNLSVGEEYFVTRMPLNIYAIRDLKKATSLLNQLTLQNRIHMAYDYNDLIP